MADLVNSSPEFQRAIENILVNDGLNKVLVRLLREADQVLTTINDCDGDSAIALATLRQQIAEAIAPCELAAAGQHTQCPSASSY